MLRKIGVVLTTVTLALMMATGNAYATMMYANTVVAWSVGPNQHPNYTDPNDALDAPDAAYVTGFYDLGGIDGDLTLGFAHSFYDGPGIDIVVREVGAQEAVDIKVKINGTGVVLSANSVSSAGTIPIPGGGTWDLWDFKFDLAGVSGTWDQLTIIDLGEKPDFAGADIDAVGVAETSIVPEPGTLLLLGTGLAGLVGYGKLRFRRRKRT